MDDAVRQLFVSCRSGDARARAQLIERYLPFAHKLARRYKRSGEPLDDLSQVAAIGLIKAIDRFDIDRGFAFASFAVPTIVGELRRHFRDRTWAVRVSRPLQELALKVPRAADTLSDELRRRPSLSEIGRAVGARDEDVLEALQAYGAYRAVSFQAPRGAAGGDEETTTLADSIGVEEQGFARAEERATLARLLSAVTVRERAVLRMLFEEQMTQVEIAAVVGVSQMHVSRMIRHSLVVLRAAHRAPAPGLAA
jgi:RNA polymerase sigma-B factor